MPKGFSLHLGLNQVDRAHYGYPGQLRSCEADANSMQSLAQAQGFITTKLLTTAATRNGTLSWLQEAANRTSAGDLVLVTYAGHGSQVPNTNNDPEDDGKDETWCLYDGQLIDDELFAAFGRFAEGVRLVVISDSCHSGSVTRAAYVAGTELQGSKTRHLPGVIAEQVYANNRAFYDGLQKPELAEAEKEVKASVILISGCQDNQESADGDNHGLFTEILLKVWQEGRYVKPSLPLKRTYRSFHKHIVQKMPGLQSPNYYTCGTPNPAFEDQKPLVI